MTRIMKLTLSAGLCFISLFELKATPASRAEMARHVAAAQAPVVAEREAARVEVAARSAERDAEARRRAQAEREAADPKNEHCKTALARLSGLDSDRCKTVPRIASDVHEVMDNAGRTKYAAHVASLAGGHGPTLTDGRQLDLKAKARVLVRYFVNRYGDRIFGTIGTITAGGAPGTLKVAGGGDIDITAPGGLSDLGNQLIMSLGGIGGGDVVKRARAFNSAMAILALNSLSDSDIPAGGARAGSVDTPHKLKVILSKNLWSMDVLFIYNLLTQCMELPDANFAGPNPTVDFNVLLGADLTVAAAAPEATDPAYTIPGVVPARVLAAAQALIAAR